MKLSESMSHQISSSFLNVLLDQQIISTCAVSPLLLISNSLNLDYRIQELFQECLNFLFYSSYSTEFSALDKCNNNIYRTTRYVEHVEVVENTFYNWHAWNYPQRLLVKELEEREIGEIIEIFETTAFLGWPRILKIVPETSWILLLLTYKGWCEVFFFFFFFF